jgi:hybrid polyketide synthase/nonribosomal peptide synthetase ACE1
MRAFFEPYALLRKTNVVSTKKLVSLASTHKIPIHFISSGELLCANDATAKANESVRKYVPKTDGSEGYLASKWASEVMLENAAKDLAVPVVIHRALETPNPEDTALQAEILEGLLGMTKEMQTLPQLAGWSGSLDLVPTQDVVNGICEKSAQQDKVTFKSYEGLVRVDIEQMSIFLEERVEVVKYQKLNVLKWLGRIKNLGFEYVISAQFLVLDAGEGKDALVSKR